MPPASSFLQAVKELHCSALPQNACEHALNISVHANRLSLQQCAAVQETLAHLDSGLLSQHKLEDIMLNIQPVANSVAMRDLPYVI
ncbi:MAG: hypothetical protein GPOALKHO_002008 [Sodalis sp.]|nr:MAG: hypothetical protein GPOALKHO_002008 [Sodalis sp.]